MGMFTWFKSKEEKEKLDKEEEEKKSEKEELLNLVESNKSGDYSTLLGRDMTLDHSFLDAEELNFLKEKGWELVSFTYETEYGYYDYIFKRVGVEKNES